MREQILNGSPLADVSNVKGYYYAIVANTNCNTHYERYLYG